MKKLIVLLTLIAVASTAMAGITTVRPMGSPFEPGLNRIMNHLYGEGNFTRIDDSKDNLWSYAWPRFTRPFFYGRAHHNMVLIMMFDRAWSAEDEIRMSVFRAHRRRIRGLEDQLHPAWDFAYLIKNIAEGRSYGFKARLVWKKFVSPEDCLKEYESWASRAAAR